MQEVALPPELRVREHVDLVASYYPDPMTAEDALRLTRTLPLARGRTGNFQTAKSARCNSR